MRKERRIKLTKLKHNFKVFCLAVTGLMWLVINLIPILYFNDNLEAGINYNISMSVLTLLFVISSFTGLHYIAKLKRY